MMPRFGDACTAGRGRGPRAGIYPVAMTTPTVLQKGEILTASISVKAEPQAVYDLVSDVTQIPSWSPECVRCEWVGLDRFKGWNRRGKGRWSTTSRVTTREPGRAFGFSTQLGRKDFTRWTYRMEPGEAAGTTLLTEEFELCRSLSKPIVWFERYVLGVDDRRADLQANLERSIDRVRELAEARVATSPAADESPSPAADDGAPTTNG
jgi:hypothetical protein